MAFCEVYGTISLNYSFVFLLDMPTHIHLFFSDDVKGDFNESFHPIRILREGGYNDCFSALHLPIAPTHPCRPSSPDEDRLVSRIAVLLQDYLSLIYVLHTDCKAL